ncbi:unnamed protein product, partial [Pylaiella littoralis]
MLTDNLSYYDVPHVQRTNVPTAFGPPSSSATTDGSYRNGVAGG